MQHTCHVDRKSNYMTCWGLNNYGQTQIPKDVTNKQAGFKTNLMAVGGFHTCAVDKDSAEIVCQGMNEFGQCIPPAEDLNNVKRKQYRDRNGDLQQFPDKVRLVSSGLHYSCIVQTLSGKLKCFGKNEMGSLDIPPEIKSNSNEVLPVDLLSSGSYHTCIVSFVAKQTQCWGANDNGQSTPSESVANRRVYYITAGCITTCVLIDYTEGFYGSNMVCFGFVQDSLEDPITNFGKDSNLIRSRLQLSVDVGQVHLCTIDIVGVLECQDVDNKDDERVVKDNPLHEVQVPTRLGRSGVGAINVSMGFESVCAVDMAMDTLCWGSDRYGQLQVPGV